MSKTLRKYYGQVFSEKLRFLQESFCHLEVTKIDRVSQIFVV